jgi:hypothetical protein
LNSSTAQYPDKRVEIKVGFFLKTYLRNFTATTIAPFAPEVDGAGLLTEGLFCGF